MFPRSLIRLLFFGGCPTAISRKISEVVVNSIKSFALRPSSHIEQKVFKFAPPPTNGDSASTVTEKIWSLFIRAPLRHIEPRNVRVRTALLCSMSMLCFVFPRSFRTQAPAAFRITTAKIRGKNNYICSAVAKASPSRELAIIRFALDYAKHSEDLSDQIIQEHKCRGTL